MAYHQRVQSFRLILQAHQDLSQAPQVFQLERFHQTYNLNYGFYYLLFIRPFMAPPVLSAPPFILLGFSLTFLRRSLPTFVEPSILDERYLSASDLLIFVAMFNILVELSL